MAGLSLSCIGLRLHRWLGLVAGLIGMAIALSGAVLVWTPALDRIVAPARYRTSGETRLAAQAYVAATQSALKPGQRIAGLSLERGSSPVLVRLDTPRRDARYLLFLDPPTARILASGVRDDGASGWLRRLHHRLFLGDAGRPVVGVMGVALLLICLTGLPPRAAGRSVKAGGRTISWHRRIGWWSILPISVMTLTGTALAFPDAFAALTGDSVAWHSETGAPPVSRTTLSVERVVASARRWSRGSLIAIDWPTERSPDWTVHFAGRPPNVIKVADDSRSAVSSPARATPLGRSWVQRLHTGREMPWIWRAIASAAGLAAAFLAGSGLIGWARNSRAGPRRQTRSTRNRSVASRPKSSM